MSDSAAAPLRGVVVCHGTVAAALVDATEQISGLTGHLVAVSNSGCDRESLEARIEAAVADGPAVVFVDMASGSCLIATLRRLRERPGVAVVTGVNLAMLVDFFFHLSLPPAEAADHAAASGGKAIRLP